MSDTWFHRYTATRGVPTLAKAYGRTNANMTVTAGLRKIGEQRLYFSVTADIYTPGKSHDPFACGCLHTEVLKYWPELAPIVALHLCDDTGAPMYADANGWYALAGYLPDHAGERYHVGNSQRHYPIVGETWKTDYRYPTSEECLHIFAEHVRAPFEKIKILVDGWIAGIPSYAAGAFIRPVYRAWIESQRPRWQTEANEAIALLDTLIADKVTR